MNRIDRISSILVQLQSRPVVKATDMAQLFGVSIRTIYRDVRTLCEAGVPVCGDSGIGYSLVDGYKLPPLMFTREEALAFVTAGKFVEQLADEQSSRFFRSGMDKIRAVLRSVDKNDLATVDNTIEVYRNSRLPNPTVPNLLQILLSSIHSRRILEMRYFTPSRNDHSVRQIEAVGVTYYYPHWLLTAYCHLRKEYRNFRLDRIEELTETGLPFTCKHPPLSELGHDYDQELLTKVVLHTTPETALQMGDRKYFHGLVSEVIANGVAEQTYMCYGLENIARWVLSHIDTVQVIEPDGVMEIIRGIISSRPSL